MTVYYYQNVNGRLFILEKILIVVLHLFARDGYETVYVSRIAGELDMTKGALYRHNKRKIFLTVLYSVWSSRWNYHASWYRFVHVSCLYIDNEIN